MTEQKIRQRLKNIRCFVLDMDGTIYLGDRLLSLIHISEPTRRS